MAAVASITTDLPPIPNIGQVIMTDEGHADEGRGRRQDARFSRRSKVGRVVAERELDGLGEELEAYWTGEGSERYSLREPRTTSTGAFSGKRSGAADQDPSTARPRTSTN